MHNFASKILKGGIPFFFLLVISFSAFAFFDSSYYLIGSSSDLGDPGNDAGLVGFWSFNAGDATDDSSNSNDGTVSGTVFNEGNGTVGYGGYFDGVDDYINVGTDLALRSNDSITISAWVYPFNEHNGGIYSRGLVTGLGKGLTLNLKSDGKIKFILCNGTASCPNSPTSASSYSTNKWNHIVGTWNGTLASIYINGVKDNNQGNIQGEINYNEPSRVLVGQSFTNGYPFNGSIDEVRIYNRSLSTEEIQNLYELVSGSWGSLTGVPAGFADDVDNNTQYSSLSEFNNDVGFITDLVNDTVPKLGGDLNVTSAYRICFNDACTHYINSTCHVYPSGGKVCGN